MTSRNFDAMPSPEHISQEGDAFPIYTDVEDKPENPVDANKSQDNPSNRTYANASHDDVTKKGDPSQDDVTKKGDPSNGHGNPVVPLGTPDQSPESNAEEKKHSHVYESLIAVPGSRVQDPEATCLIQCSRGRRCVLLIAISALILGFLLGFLPTYLAWTAGGMETCQPGFAPSPQFSKCYRFVLIPLPWEEAREHCLAVGAVLLQLANRAEARDLVSLANHESVPMEIGSPAAHFWTGGVRAAPNVTGSHFRWDASGDALPRDSPLWHKGEPNNFGRAENYVELRLTDEGEDSGLNDVSQRDNFSICESPLLV